MKHQLLGGICILCVMILCGTTNLWATEPMARAVFLEVTNTVMDALDNVETIILSHSDVMKLEARLAVDKLKATLKKYDRYISGKWPKGRQFEIVNSLTQPSVPI